MSMIEDLQSFGCFTNSEKAVIDVIFRDPDALPELTAQQLAKAAYTSTSTVVRLGQKVGCKTYSEFRTKLVAEMQRRSNGNAYVDPNVPFHEGDSTEAILRQITDLQINAVNETLALLDSGRYNRAVEMLAGAKCIGIYGHSMNMHLAHSFADKMWRIGYRVQVTEDYDEQIINAISAAPGHCGIVISYTGEREPAIKSARALKDRGIPVLAITSVGDNTVASMADERLLIASQEKFALNKMAAISSSISITAIMNCLYAGVFARDYENNYNKRNEIVGDILKYM